MHVAVVTLNTENNKTLSDLLKKGFKRSIFWNVYNSKIQRVTTGNANENTDTHTQKNY